MKRTSLTDFCSKACWLLAGALGFLPQLVAATQAYNNPGPFATPYLSPTTSPALPAPWQVPGEEYSHNEDSTTVGAVGVPPPADAEQVINWDGLGGAMDGIDYSDSPRPDYDQLGQVDALANFADTLFQEVLDDKAHLVFSVSKTAYNPSLGTVSIPSAGPINLLDHTSIGGAGELSYELAGPLSIKGTWADQSAINAMPGPTDLDAVELWGPEPSLITNPQILGDSNRYSLENDSASGVSVWGRKLNPDSSYTSFPYVSHSAIVAAVVAQLGSTTLLPEEELAQLIDVDALMAYDLPGTDTRTFTSGDRILFSIRQIIIDTGLSTHIYAFGSEILWLDGSGASGFLFHGGHSWNQFNSMQRMYARNLDSPEINGWLDINALEAVAIQVPEPASAVLILLGLVTMGYWNRRSG